MKHRVLLATLLLLACGGPTVTAPTTVIEAPAPTVLQVSPPEPAENVALMDQVCAEGATERCNAIDDDCDGRIDEGCEGALDGAFVAAVAWNGDADVDLVLTGPTDAEPTRVASRDGCASETDPRVERAAFPELAPGRYRVELVNAESCGDTAITTSTSIAVNGSVLGVFNRPLDPGQRAPVIELEVTAAPRATAAP